jgi:hypothetical protein
MTTPKSNLFEYNKHFRKAFDSIFWKLEVFSGFGTYVMLTGMVNLP